MKPKQSKGKTSMNKHTRFTDNYGDSLIFTSNVAHHAYIRFRERSNTAVFDDDSDDKVISLTPKQVIKLRKTLKRWLRTHGHIKPEKPKRNVVVTFDPEVNEQRVIAVTVEDAENNLVETIWKQ